MKVEKVIECGDVEAAWVDLRRRGYCVMRIDGGQLAKCAELMEEEYYCVPYLTLHDLPHAESCASRAQRTLRACDARRCETHTEPLLGKAFEQIIARQGMNVDALGYKKPIDNHRTLISWRCDSCEVGRQSAHRDMPAIKMMKPRNAGVVAMTPLCNQMFMYMWPCEWSDESLPAYHRGQCDLIRVPKGCVLYWLGDLMHSGANYATMNIHIRCMIRGHSPYRESIVYDMMKEEAPQSYRRISFV